MGGVSFPYSRFVHLFLDGIYENLLALSINRNAPDIELNAPYMVPEIQTHTLKNVEMTTKNSLLFRGGKEKVMDNMMFLALSVWCEGLSMPPM